MPSDETIIWRYMDFTKFAQLLYTNSIWFSRVDKLSDQYEGELPYQNSNEFMDRLYSIDPNMPFNEMLDRAIKERQNIRIFKSFSYVNCWSIDPCESYALWKIYLEGGKQGVAIKSTVGRIKSAFEKSEYKGVIGKVNYKDSVERVNQDLIIGTKKPYYKYENELRIMIMNQFELRENDNGKSVKVPLNITGMNLKIDLMKLVDRIVISPFSEHWFLKLISEMTQEKKPGLIIHKSRLIDN